MWIRFNQRYTFEEWYNFSNPGKRIFLYLSNNKLFKHNYPVTNFVEITEFEYLFNFAKYKTKYKYENNNVAVYFICG